MNIGEKLMFCQTIMSLNSAIEHTRHNLLEEQNVKNKTNLDRSLQLQIDVMQLLSRKLRDG